jgi:hypothetical protein
MAWYRDSFTFSFTIHEDGATARHRLPAAVARARSLVRSCENFGNGTGLLRAGFSCQFSFHQMRHICQLFYYYRSMASILTKKLHHTEHDRCIGLTTLPLSVSRLSTERGILNISQPYKPPRLSFFTFTFIRMYWKRQDCVWRHGRTRGLIAASCRTLG